MKVVSIERNDDTGFYVRVDGESAPPWYATLDDAMEYARDVLAGTNVSGDAR